MPAPAGRPQPPHERSLSRRTAPSHQPFGDSLGGVKRWPPPLAATGLDEEGFARAGGTGAAVGLWEGGVFRGSARIVANHRSTEAGSVVAFLQGPQRPADNATASGRMRVWPRILGAAVGCSRWSPGQPPNGGGGIEPPVMPHAAPRRERGTGGLRQPHPGPAPEWGRQSPETQGSAAPIRGLGRFCGPDPTVPRPRPRQRIGRGASPWALFRRPHSGAGREWEPRRLRWVWTCRPKAVEQGTPRSGARPGGCNPLDSLAQASYPAPVVGSVGSARTVSDGHRSLNVGRHPAPPSR